jgi:serine/threonine protein kinase
LSWWPSPQDYNEAVQHPGQNLDDAEMKEGLVYLDSLGIPRPVTGSFASVYRLKCRRRDLALRCFLRNIADQRQRYDMISQFVQHDDLPCTVTFEFLERGIRSGSNWFPVLKMEWVEGEPLDRYILQNLGRPEKLGQLAANFLAVVNDLRRAGIAHGDLQHGNIMVLADGELRLVDYDGMYVPSMQNMKSNERGHSNYQHPQRRDEQFGPYMDNFSAWVIYTSIIALQVDPRLWRQLAAGDDCLLFRQSDFLNPESSPAFAALETHSDSRLQGLARFLRAQLGLSPVDVPCLEDMPPDSEPLSALLPGVSPVRSGPRIASNALPDWWRGDNLELLSMPGKEESVTPAIKEQLSKPEPLAPSAVPWIDPGLPQNPATAGSTLPARRAAAAVSDWSMEPELIQDRPRRLDFSPHVKGMFNFAIVGAAILLYLLVLANAAGAVLPCLMWLAAMAGPSILFALAAVLSSAWHQKTLVANGEAVVAEVVDKNFRSANSSGAAARYFIRLRYVERLPYSQTGIVIYKEVRCSEEEYTGAFAGNHMTVLYDPKNAESMVVYKQCWFCAVEPAGTP